METRKDSSEEEENNQGMDTGEELGSVSRRKKKEKEKRIMRI